MGKRFLNSLSLSCLILVNLTFFINASIAETPAKVVINYIEVNQADDYSGNQVKTYLTATSTDNSPVTDIYKGKLMIYVPFCSLCHQKLIIPVNPSGV